MFFGDFLACRRGDFFKSVLVCEEESLGVVVEGWVGLVRLFLGWYAVAVCDCFTQR